MRSKFAAKGQGLEKLRKLARELSIRPQVKIGVLGAAVYHGDELTNAELAAIHEFGAPRAGVPERSFLRSTADQKRRQWIDLLTKVLEKAVEGKTTPQVALELVGQKAVADVVAHIRTGAGIPPPLKPATIAAKGSTRPLVDTGRLVQSISYAVVRPGRSS